METKVYLIWSEGCPEDTAPIAAFTDKELADAWAAEFGYPDHLRTECVLNPSIEETRAQVPQ